jgi:hypothetical protein
MPEKEGKPGDSCGGEFELAEVDRINRIFED